MTTLQKQFSFCALIMALMTFSCYSLDVESATTENLDLSLVTTSLKDNEIALDNQDSDDDEDGSGQSFAPTDINWDEILTLLANLRKENFEKAALKRQEMFNLAAQVDDGQETALDIEIMAVTAQYEELVKSLNIGVMLIQQVADIIPQLKAHGTDIASAEVVDAVLIELYKFYQALLSGAFMETLKGPSVNQGMSALINLQSLLTGPPAGDNTVNLYEKIPYSIEDLRALIKAFSSLVMVPLFEAQPLVEKIELLKKFLVSIESRNPNDITLAALEYIKPTFEGVYAAMGSLIDRLQACGGLEIHITHKEAVEYFLDGAYKDNATLRTFDSLQKNARLNPSYDFQSFFKLAASAYDVSMVLLKFYTSDWDYARESENYRRNAFGAPLLGTFERRYYMPYLIDGSFRAALAGWCFTNKSAENKAELLFNTISGDIKLPGLKASHMPLFTLMALPLMGPSLAGRPNIFNKSNKVHDSVAHVAASYAYYQLFYSFLFNRNAHLNNGNPEAGVHSWWPREDRHFVGALAGVSVCAADVFADIMRMQVRKNLPPQLLQQVEDYTLHMIRPEVISVVLRVALPVLLVDRSEWDEVGLSGDELRAHRIDQDGKPLSVVQKFSKFTPYHFIPSKDVRNLSNLARKNGADPRFCHVEMALFSHVAASLGMHWGRYFAGKYTKSIVSGLGRGADAMVNVLGGIGLLGDEGVEFYQDFKRDINQEMADNIELLKYLIKGFFDPRSEIRKTAMGMLVEHGYLDKHEKDPMKVNQSLIYMLFYELASRRVLDYVQASELIALYEKNPKNLDRMIDLTIGYVSANLVALGGGYLASFIAEGLAKELYLGGTFSVPYSYDRTKKEFVWSNTEYGIGPVYTRFVK